MTMTTLIKLLTMAGVAGLVTASLSAQTADMVFVSVNPCVIFDTRPAFGGSGAFSTGEERGFEIAGSAADFESQGGTGGGCGVPDESEGAAVARAVFINYVAIEPQGGGQIKAWAFDKTEPSQGALVNYQALNPPMNNSNAVITQLRQGSAGPHIKVKALSASTHIRGVVMGYFTAEHITGVIAGTGLAGGALSGHATLSIQAQGVQLRHLSAAGSTPGQMLLSGPTVQWGNRPGPAGPTGATGPTGPAGPEGLTPTLPGFTVTQFDPQGSSPSVAIGTDGMALIGYKNSSGLKVAHCLNTACTSFTTSTIVEDAGFGTSGNIISLAVGSDGFGLISFGISTFFGTSLWVAHCNDIPCSSATVTLVEGIGGLYGGLNSIAIGADGLGIISYMGNGIAYDLKVAHCENVECTDLTISTLDSLGELGIHSSIAIGSDGLALISYGHVDSLNDLKVAHCSNVACTTANPWTVDTEGGRDSSLTMANDGRGLISYEAGNQLKVAHCTNVTCSNVIDTTIDTTASTITSTAITIGPDGLGLIAYTSSSGLEIAHCSNSDCTAATNITLPAGASGVSMTIGSDGLPLLVSGGSIIHLSNSFGIPYHRRR
jgi:hypothetical protein